MHAGVYAQQLYLACTAYVTCTSTAAVASKDAVCVAAAKQFVHMVMAHVTKIL
jgi:hypothetical protein